MTIVRKDKVVVFDTETTGLNPYRNEILQFSAVDGNGNLLLDTYICPEAQSWEEAEEINGISPEMVKNAPKKEDVNDQILSIMENADLIVGYNASFDLSFLHTHFGFTPSREQQVFDVMTEFAVIYGMWNDYFQDYVWQKLSVCADFYGYEWPEEGMHNSLGDTKATLFCFKKMIESADQVPHGDMDQQFVLV